MTATFRPALVLFAALSLITGIAYPLVVTGIAQAAMPFQASGSIVRRDGKAVGSLLIGQSFSDPRHFWSRPSATSPGPNNATASGGSNLGPSNPALADAVKGRIDALRAADPGNTRAGSGRSGDGIGQRPRSRDQRRRGALSGEPDRPRKQHPGRAPGCAHRRARKGQALGFLGEPRVNVLVLNLALDAMPH